MNFFGKKANKSNRTIKYGGSPRVFSYYASRLNNSEQYSESSTRISDGDKTIFTKMRFIKLKKHRLSHWVFVAALLVGGFFALSLDAKPRISVLPVNSLSATLSQDPSVYENAALRLIKSSPFNRFKPVINTLSLADDLKAEFPELSEVSVRVPLVTRKTIFEVKPSVPTFIIVSKSGISFVIDENGRAVVELARVKNKESLNGLVFINDDSGLEISTGESVLPREDVEFIRATIYQLESGGQKIMEMSLPQVANELHLRLEGDPYFVKFNMAGDTRIQAGALLAVKQKFQQEAITPSEYIDVRVEEKAYFK